MCHTNLTPCFHKVQIKYLGQVIYNASVISRGIPELNIVSLQLYKQLTRLCDRIHKIPITREKLKESFSARITFEILTLFNSTWSGLMWFRRKLCIEKIQKLRVCKISQKYHKLFLWSKKHNFLEYCSGTFRWLGLW